LWSVYQQGGYVANIDVLVAVYLGGWFLVTLAGHVASRWFGHRWSPPAHPLLVSAVAGAVWPLLLIGLTELSSIVVYVHCWAKPETVWRPRSAAHTLSSPTTMVS
jgi:hypothetical protein